MILDDISVILDITEDSLREISGKSEKSYEL
jgi:hypothetical protein